ncbi:MAG TPA: hypothetical protein VEY33_09945 [Gemmatimonadota bacterium]|nr:hypothetical protein [Gemmatimonadota bacterium]
MVELPIDQRLAAIEARLAALEKNFDTARQPISETPSVSGVPLAVSTATSRVTEARPPIVQAAPQPSGAAAPLGFEISASTILGWAGAGALLLAAAYFVRLAIAEG